MKKLNINTIRTIFVSTNRIKFMENKPKDNPTVLDYAILGLLQREPLSGYRIRKIFETTALGHYSGSPGAIYPALKRLQRLNLIRHVIGSGDSARSKKLFHIKPKGTKMLAEWLVKPVEREDVTKRISQLILRFAFMDNLISKVQKTNFLKSFIKEIRDYVKQLEQNYNIEQENMLLHGRLALRNGIEVYKANLRWARNALKAVTKNSKT
jgi:DNA-binding PadR family transcriptional regulator